MKNVLPVFATGLAALWAGAWLFNFIPENWIKLWFGSALLLTVGLAVFGWLAWLADAVTLGRSFPWRDRQQPVRNGLHHPDTAMAEAFQAHYGTPLEHPDNQGKAIVWIVAWNAALESRAWRNP